MHSGMTIIGIETGETRALEASIASATPTSRCGR